MRSPGRPANGKGKMRPLRLVGLELAASKDSFGASLTQARQAVATLMSTSRRSYAEIGVGPSVAA